MIAIYLPEERNRVPAALVKHLVLIVAWLLATTPCFAEETTAAVESITVKELTDYVEALADDVYEGRGTGTRGSHAAAQYILQQIEPLQFEPAGVDGSYFQSWDKGQQNILALHRGTDPKLGEEFILVGAHFDHIGLGDKGRRRGPIGVIYNGADDNASGVSALLEVMEALATFQVPTRRSVLFVFWDAEEVGLVGSQHWIDNPTLPLEKMRLVFNLDMLGRLRDGQLYVHGTRSGYGLRRFASGSPPESLQLDFGWELTGNSDHWTFFQRKFPILMLHTGLHEDYHRPTDDPEHINGPGLCDASRYLFTLVVKAADADELPAFRPNSEHETESGRRALEKPLEPVALTEWPKDAPRPRVGIAWRDDDAEPGTVFLTRVITGSPAEAAGLAVGDRIQAINEEGFADKDAFSERIMALARSAHSPFELTVETHGHIRTVTIDLPPPEPDIAQPEPQLTPVEEEPTLIPVSEDEDQPIIRPTDAVPEPEEDEEE